MECKQRGTLFSLRTKLLIDSAQMFFLRLIPALLVSTVLSAEGLELMHAFNANSTVGRWRVQMQGRLRTHRGGGELFQNRFGPTAWFRLGKGVSLSGGTHFSWQRDRSNRWDYFQRVLAGVDHPLLERGRNQVQHRVLYEGFLGRRNVSPARWRDRIRYVRTRDSISPFIAAEVLASPGSVDHRYSAGAVWRLARLGLFETTYEFRRAGPQTSHIISTAMHWDWRRPTESD